MRVLLMSGNHFQGKEPIHHIAAKQAQGIAAESESHATEIPGSLAAAADTCRDMAIGGVLVSLFLHACHFSDLQILWFFVLFVCSWSLWKACRSAWLAWSRLERLHRTLAEERWEIQHNRPQERQELAALYSEKGFKGKLLEEVLDVLMADEERLLKVMVQEELGLTLQSSEHPLKQGIGAFLGGLIAGFFLMIFFAFSPHIGLPLASIAILASTAGLSAYYEKNQIIPSIVWNAGIGVLVIGSGYFLFQFFMLQGWI